MLPTTHRHVSPAVISCKLLVVILIAQGLQQEQQHRDMLVCRGDLLHFPRFTLKKHPPVLHSRAMKHSARWKRDCVSVHASCVACMAPQDSSVVVESRVAVTHCVAPLQCRAGYVCYKQSVESAIHMIWAAFEAPSNLPQLQMLTASGQADAKLPYAAP